jgi:MHS family proline/betaine transporter-like MFS transporter
MLEWYDFALFGFFAQQIGAHFFPAHDKTASLLAAFGTFAAGFFMRQSAGRCSAGSATGSAASRR